MIFIKNEHEKSIHYHYKKKNYFVNSEGVYFYSNRVILSRRKLFFNRHFDFNLNFIFYNQKSIFKLKKKICNKTFFYKRNKMFCFFKKNKFTNIKIRKIYFFIVKKLINSKNFKKMKKKFNFFFCKKSIVNTKIKYYNYTNNFFNKNFKIKKKKFIFKKWWKKKKCRRKKKNVYLFKMFSIQNQKNDEKKRKNFKIIKFVQNTRKINFTYFCKKTFNFFNVQNKIKNCVSITDKNFKINCKENYVIRKKNYYIFNKVWLKNYINNDFFVFMLNQFIFEIFYNVNFFRRMKRNKKHRRWQRFFFREIIFFMKSFIKIKKIIQSNYKHNFSTKITFYYTYNYYFKNEFYKKAIIRCFSEMKSFVNKHNKKFKKYTCFNDFYFSKISKINRNFFIRKYFKIKKNKKIKFNREIFVKTLRVVTRKRIRKEKRDKYWESYWNRHFRQYNESIYGEWSKDEENRWEIIECFIEKRDKWIMQRDKKRPRRTFFEDYEMPHNPIFHESIIYNFSYEKEKVLKEYKSRFIKKKMKKINIKKYIVKRTKEPDYSFMKRLMLLPSEFEYEMYGLCYTRTNESFDFNFGYVKKIKKPELPKMSKRKKFKYIWYIYNKLKKIKEQELTLLDTFITKLKNKHFGFNFGFAKKK